MLRIPWAASGLVWTFSFDAAILMSAVAVRVAKLLTVLALRNGRLPFSLENNTLMVEDSKFEQLFDVALGAQLNEPHGV